MARGWAILSRGRRPLDGNRPPTREAHADTMGTDRRRDFGPAPKAAVRGRVLGPGFKPCGRCLKPSVAEVGGHGGPCFPHTPKPRLRPGAHGGGVGGAAPVRSLEGPTATREDRPVTADPSLG
ncbi:hypothetical protein GCM10022205_36880 [Spinactinospora alkalitolerans]